MGTRKVLIKGKELSHACEALAMLIPCDICMYRSKHGCAWINNYLIKTPAMILPTNIIMDILYTRTYSPHSRLFVSVR
jgi:hypothetical protein